MRRFGPACAAVVLMCSGMVYATGQGAPREVIATGGIVSSLIAAPVKGEPYSATQTTETTRTLNDGNKITRHGHHLVARDSDGRVMVERRLSNGRNGSPEIEMTFVVDPVAHTLTTWMTGGNEPQVATVAKLKKADEPGGIAASPAGEASSRNASRPQPIITSTDLGTRLIDGVPATGVLKTTVVPPGRSGNDQPITKTHEVWTSDELKLILLQKWEDPRTGERIVQFANFSRAEPAPKLFLPPAGYQRRTLEQSLKDIADRLEQMAAQP